MSTGVQAQIGNVDLVKQLNGTAVYHLIDQQGPISRIQIAEFSQLAPASVTKITRQLLERGLNQRSRSASLHRWLPRYLHRLRNPSFPHRRSASWSSRCEHRVCQLLTQGYPSKLKLDDCNINAICMAANRNDRLAVEMIEHVGYCCQ